MQKRCAVCGTKLQDSGKLHSVSFHVCVNCEPMVRRDMEQRRRDFSRQSLEILTKAQQGDEGAKRILRMCSDYVGRLSAEQNTVFPR